MCEGYSAQDLSDAVSIASDLIGVQCDRPLAISSCSRLWAEISEADHSPNSIRQKDYSSR